MGSSLKGENLLRLELILSFMRGNNENDRVASPGRVPIHLNSLFWPIFIPYLAIVAYRGNVSQVTR